MPAASASPPRRLAAQPCRRPSPPRRKWTASRGNPCARRSGSGARRAPRSSAATAARWSSRRCPSSKVPRRNPPRGPASSPRPPVPSLRPLCPVPVSSPPLLLRPLSPAVAPPFSLQGGCEEEPGAPGIMSRACLGPPQRFFGGWCLPRRGLRNEAVSQKPG